PQLLQHAAVPVSETPAAPDGECKTRTPTKQQAALQKLLDKIHDFRESGAWADLSPHCKELFERNAGDLVSFVEVWERVTRADKFHKGDVDIDSLCSEFKKKACCTETQAFLKKVGVEEIMSAHDLL
ncbi:hypothetical protein KEM52_005156, partial [Ascosphaera acerosa]